MINIDDLEGRFILDKEEFADTPYTDREDKAYLKGKLEVHRLYRNKLKDTVILDKSEYARLREAINKHCKSCSYVDTETCDACELKEYNTL